MNYFCCFLLFCLCISGIAGYSVTGNKISDPNGNQVLLRGVDRPSFEWSVSGEEASASDYMLMSQWGANVVRLATNQDFWLSNTTGVTYQANIDQQVTWATAAGMGIIIDLHWNNGGQQMMADRNSITYWSQVAAKYQNNPWVMFELYNEPHDISWTQWLSGDATYAGMQEMYAAVRAAGANNLCLVGGLNWAFDLSGVGAGYAVQGTNVAYATHPYDYAGKQLADWPAAFGYLVPTYPVVMTEFGQYCNVDTYVSDLLTYAQTNAIHWTAWAWYVSGCSFPSIIADWNGTPISGVGELVQSYLSGNAPAAPPVIPPPTSGTNSTSPPAASSAMTVYTDSLASGWQDWSWASSYSLESTTYVYSGSNSIEFNVQEYQGIYLHYTSSFAIGGYSTLQFYVNGGLSAVSASALSVQIYGTADTTIGNSVNFPVSVPVSQWSLVSINLNSFGVSASTQVSGFVIQSNVDASAGNIWIDNISFLAAGSSTAAPTLAPTSAPTRAPTAAPTQMPTAAPTNKPTPAPTQQATAAPTPAPTQMATAATSAPSSGCDASSVQISQSLVNSWQSGGQTVTQYNVQVSTTCSSQALVGLTLAAAGWNAVSFWNAAASPSPSAIGETILTVPSYFHVTSSSPFVIGYQNVGGQASFSVTSATFQ